MKTVSRRSAIGGALLSGIALVAAAQLCDAASGGAAAHVVRQRIDGSGNWGLDRIDQARGTDGVYTYSATGAGVRVYVVGTGVLSGHIDFGGRATYIGDFCTGVLRPGSQEVDAADGFDGHETHAASYAAGARSGVAKRARILSLRTAWHASFSASANGGASCRGDESDEAVAAAFEWIEIHGVRPAVVNYSGGRGNGKVQAAVERALAAGFTVTLSGNTGGSVASHWGATVPKTAIVVGGIDRGDTALAASAYDTDGSSLLALYAPADGLRGAGKASRTDFSIPEEDGCASRCTGGDSFAAPFVAGAAAQYLEQHPQASPCEVRQAILDSSTRDEVRFRAPGERSVNRLLRIPVKLMTVPNCG